MLEAWNDQIAPLDTSVMEQCREYVDNGDRQSGQSGSRKKEPGGTDAHCRRRGARFGVGARTAGAGICGGCRLGTKHRTCRGRDAA